MKIKLTLLYFLLLVTFSAIANYNLPKEKLKKVKLHLNNKTFELCVPKGYMLSINYTTEEIEYLFRYQDSSCIYLSGFFYCKNERNINLLGDSIYNLRFQNTKHQFSKTLTYTMLERVHTKLLSTKLFSFYYVQEFINHF